MRAGTVSDVGGAAVPELRYPHAMSVSVKLPVRMTVEEFLDWNPGDGQRYELVDGVPRAMAPARPTHGLLQTELTRQIGNHLREHRPECDVVSNPGIVPQLMSAHNCRVPDLAVTCSPLEPGQLVLSGAVLIIEILSPSNEGETWTNVWAYTSIASVQEILVLHSTKLAAELLRRTSDGAWPARTTTVTTGTLRLESIDFQMPLADLCARTPLAR